MIQARPSPQASHRQQRSTNPTPTTQTSAWFSRCLGIVLTSLIATSASAQTPWPQIEQSARGQTVYFNAWGGGEAINAYIQWAAQQVKNQYGIKLKHVKISDAAEIVQRIRAEKQTGRDQQGSVDLLWINGENFHALKSAQALHGPWVKQLPNWQHVDKTKPVETDFSVATDGYEAPWGMAQLTFIADRATLAQPPNSIAELLTLAKQRPGKITYPKPPSFHGTTFLKQALSELIDDPSLLQQPVDPSQFAQISQPLWHYLDQLHPHLWRQGKAFANGIADMHRQLADGELLLSMTFNPNEGANLVASEQLPPSAYSFGFGQGTIANVHFLAIPYNAQAKPAAMVVANFLLSPQAQSRKADPQVWGDPSVLLSEQITANFTSSKTPGRIEKPFPSLKEPHASWVSALEKAWTTRYGVQ